jgi:hypothetical protein
MLIATNGRVLRPELATPLSHGDKTYDLECAETVYSLCHVMRGWCQYHWCETQSCNKPWDSINVVGFVRFQVLTAASMKFRSVFWDVLPCKIIVDRRFRGTNCLNHHSSLMMQAGRRSTIILHGSTSQKTILNVVGFIDQLRHYQQFQKTVLWGETYLNCCH